MKSILMTALPFVFAFVFVTGGIIYLNSSFNDIFHFDFSPKQVENNQPKDNKNGEKKKKELNQSEESKVTELENKTIEPEVVENRVDSVNKEEKINPPVNIIDSSKTKEQKIVPTVKENITLTSNKQSNKDSLIKAPVAELKIPDKKSKNDTAYVNWLKSTSSLYEALEPKKAAKIIQSYSDNVARDILYTMKKKQAAKVISELSPEVVNRIIRYE